MAGRPTTCTQDVIDKAWEYVNGGWAEVEHAWPSAVGLMDYISVKKSTLYDWAKDSDKPISDILEKINQKQELIAWNKGVKNEYNANLVKLLLGKHGYHDKQDNTHSGPDGQPIKTDNKYTIEIVEGNAKD